MTQRGDLVLVDTSMWVQFFNLPDSAERAAVDDLIDREVVATTGIIVSEVLQGARSTSHFTEIAEFMEGPRYLELTHPLWINAGALAFDMKMKGQPIPMSDVLIGVAAVEYGCSLYTGDHHFERVPGLTLYSPVSRGGLSA